MPPSNPITISIRPGGEVECIYDDNALDLYDALGTHTVRRASHVEPGGEGWNPGGKGWQADMGPMGGPILWPYRTRQQALDAETEWLRRRGY